MRSQLERRTRIAHFHWHWPEGADFKEALFFPDGVEVDDVRFPFEGPPMSARLTETAPGAIGLELRICLMPGHEQRILLPVPAGRIAEAQEVRRFVNERGHGRV